MIHLNEATKRLITGIILIAVFCCSYAYSKMLFCAILAVMMHVIMHYEWPRLMPNMGSVLGLLYSQLYPMAPLVQLFWLTIQYHDTDFYLPIYPIIIAWTADTAGYVVGKILGRHKMCPSISPGKSWEGFAGSFVGVIVMHSWLLPKIHLFKNSVLLSSANMLILFSLFITIISFLGGLFLSYLKRQQGLKDAGSLLPGHGGFLDRFDGVFFVTYITVFLVLAMR